MLPIVSYIAVFIVSMHGLVHLLYFVSYWPIAKIEEVPYKTVLLNGRWDVGSAIWLSAAKGFVDGLSIPLLGGEFVTKYCNVRHEWGGYDAKQLYRSKGTRSVAHRFR